MTSKVKSILHHINRRDTQIIPKINNKYFKIVLIFLALVSTVFITRSIIAQESTTSPSNSVLKSSEDNPIKQKQDAIKNGDNLESWTNESLSSNAVSGLTALTGEVPDDVLSGKQTTWIPGGLLGQTTKYIGYLMTPQASGIEYIAQGVNNFLGKPAYAEDGIGFNGLQPILPIWKAFRNTVYIFISVVFVVIGILIMLRIKISPQTIINIQNSIPKLITTLILVTFSYAIAGLLIDFSYVISGLIASVLLNSSLKNVTTAINGSIANSMIDTILSGYQQPVIDEFKKQVSFASIINPSMFVLFSGMGRMIQWGGVMGLSVLIGAALAPFTIGVSAILGILGIIIIPLVLAIMIFVNMIKLLIGLAKCYLNVLLKIILAPLEIGVGSIPNMKIGFGSWFIGLIANLAVFPIVSVFIILVNVILINIEDFGQQFWVPSALTFGGDMGVNGWVVKTIIGLAAFLLLPKLPTLIPEAIFQLKPSPFGKAIGESVAPYGASVGKMAKGGARFGASQAGGAIGALGYEADGKTQRSGRGARVQRVVGKLSDYFASKH